MLCCLLIVNCCEYKSQEVNRRCLNGLYIYRKKRIRKSFSKRPAESQLIEIPHLLATQLDSYHKFLQSDIEPGQRIDQGLQAAFKSVFRSRAIMDMPHWILSVID